MTIIKNIVSAIQFLTIIPIPLNTEYDNLKKSIAHFPLAGTIIGGCLYLCHYFFSIYLDVGISSALTILVYIILMRGIHLDGFMDTIDGFFSYKSRDEILRIMKESTVGSFAVLGAGVWFLVLYSCIPHFKLMHYILIFTFSRCSIILLPLIFSYPRESGTGKFFAENVDYFVLIKSLFWTCIPVVYFSYYNFIFLAGTFVIAFIIGLWSKKMIQGFTGDVIGFTVESNILLLSVFYIATGV